MIHEILKQGDVVGLNDHDYYYYRIEEVDYSRKRYNLRPVDEMSGQVLADERPEYLTFNEMKKQVQEVII